MHRNKLGNKPVRFIKPTKLNSMGSLKRGDTNRIVKTALNVGVGLALLGVAAGVAKNAFDSN